MNSEDMLSETRQDKYCTIPPHELPRVAIFLDTESRMVIARFGLPRWLSDLKKKKNQPIQENQEMQFQSGDQEDPLEQERASHSRVLDWRIPWQEEPGGLQPTGLQSAEQSAQT